MDTNIVFITIGEAPRLDLKDIFEAFFGDVDSVKQIGLLDNLTHADAENKFSIERDGESTLTSRFINGHQIVMSHHKVEIALQILIDKLEQNGVKVIVLLCTGEFQHLKTSKAQLITAEDITIPFIKNKYNQPAILGIVTPLEEQIESSRHKWQLGEKAVFTSASPYNFERSSFENAAQFLTNKNVAAVVLDCIGYDKKMQKILQDNLNDIPVYLSNEILFEYVSEEFLTV